MRLFKLASFLMSLLICTNAYAEWTEIGKSSDTTIYVEYSRSKFDKNTADAWMKFKLQKIKTLPNNVKTNSMVVRIAVICDQNKIMYQFVEHRLDDKFVYSSENPSKEYEETVPGSENDGVLKLLCGIGQNR